MLLSAVLFWLTGMAGLYSQAVPPAAARKVFVPPGSEEKPVVREKEAILINGRLLRPAGQLVRTQSYSWGMSLHPQKDWIALVNKDAVQLFNLQDPGQTRRYPPFGIKRPDEFGKGSYMGSAFSPDGTLFYMGDADTGRILILDAEQGKVTGAIRLDGKGYRDSFPGDFKMAPDGKTLVVLDQFNNRLVLIDLPRRTVRASVRVGRNPFALSLSGDGRTAWVCHVGMFLYPLLPGVKPENRESAGLTFPAYGFPSKEMEQGTTVEGIRVPGLGSPNHPDAMAVFQVDLLHKKVVRVIRTGYKVGQNRDGIRTIGGAHPAAVAVGEKTIYISNAGNDTISLVDAATGAVVQEIPLVAPGMEHLRGVLPFGLAVDDQEKRLYVACAGANAVAVLDLQRRECQGWIPAGWFCNLVKLSSDGRRLYISSAKGMGSGPNGGLGFRAPVRGTHPGDIMQGLLQIAEVPDGERLAALTRQVWEGFGQWKDLPPEAAGHPVPPAAGAGRSPIEHIVFIVKENRTFDQVFGQRAGADGDPSLAGLGMGVNIANKAKTAFLQGVDISPNHQALADRFAISDNFYCDSDQSNTGHRWVAGVYPNEWTEVNARSRIESRPFSSAPGRRNVNGSSATVLPEDYNEAGALWEHLDRHKVSFYNFGMGTEMPASLEEQAFRHTGIRMSVSFPLPKPLFDNTSRTYATYNMAIPDQYRVDAFEEEFRRKWESGPDPLPRLITMVLPNDHMTDEHPADGFPFRESYMADNDLALGRIVHFLSRTAYWKKMLIIVTEDDPQGGLDHVEAHRSLLLMIGPHVKRGFVSHQLADFASIMKLMFVLLDMPPLNQFDAAATLPLDFFSAEPDFRPYTLLPVDRRLFDPDAALKPFDRKFNWKHYLQSVRMDDPEDMREWHRRQLPAERD